MLGLRFWQSQTLAKPKPIKRKRFEYYEEKMQSVSRVREGTLRGYLEGELGSLGNVSVL